MPTFHSIPIHPSVRARLLQPQREHPAGDSDGQQMQNPQQQQQQQQQQQIQQPVKSNVAIPRSLLTRDPNDLAGMFSNGNNNNNNNHNERDRRMAGILALRNQVASAMISKTRNGKRLLLCCHPKDLRGHPQKRRRREQDAGTDVPLIPGGGSLSLLQARNLQRAARSKSPERRPEVFSTGCRALDDLVAFPAEYCFSSSFDDERGDCGGDPDGVVERAAAEAAAASEIVPETVDALSGTARGLPRGYVVKLSGTIGKTQLALQFAARAATQSQSKSRSMPTSRPRSSRGGCGGERIRYCYSTAGHSGASLARRVFQHISAIHESPGNERGASDEVAKRIEFQPVASLAQLVATIAKLEREWREHAAWKSESTSESTSTSESESKPPDQQSLNRGSPGDKAPVSMLVLDALPWMLVEREEPERIRSLNRWLKRLARHYSVWIVVVTTSTGDGGTATSTSTSASSSSSSSLYSHTMPCDIHLGLQKQSTANNGTSSLRLMRHPARAVTGQDCITILHDSRFGITTPD